MDGGACSTGGNTIVSISFTTYKTMMPTMYNDFGVSAVGLHADRLLALGSLHRLCDGIRHVSMGGRRK